MWDDVLSMRRQEGVTVFLTTHYMDEAEVADRIGIIDHGRLVALDSPENLKLAVGADTVELHTHDDAAALTAITAAGYRASRSEQAVTVFTANGEAQVGPLVEAIGGGVVSVHVHRPTLDDVFLHYTGRQIRDSGGEMTSGMARAWRHR